MVRHMSDGGPGKQQYMVNIYESKDTPEALVFTFVPKGLPGTHGTDERPQRVPQYIVLVQGNDGTMAFDWSRTPDDPGTARAELEHEARQRVKSRTRWIGMVTDLVVVVEQWGQELGWATRRIEKRLDDSQIGKHQVPALLMQEGTCRVMLEPVGRSAPELRVLSIFTGCRPMTTSQLCIIMENAGTYITFSQAVPPPVSEKRRVFHSPRKRCKESLKS